MDWVSGAASKRQFEVFAAAASDSLLRTGYLMTGDVKDAEDLVQETFLRVARRWNRVRSMDHPAAYARRILINLVLDGAGRRSRQQAELGPEDVGIDAADESATRALREVDDLAEFRWALAQLPARQRAVLVLRYWEDLPVAEVADVLGCSAGTRSPAPHPAPQPGWPRRLPAAGCLPPDPPPGHHERNYPMPTDELEGQLRSTLARAAADFENPDQVRQRLLQRDYHPRRGSRRLAAGITTGAALVVGLVAVIAAVGHGPATKATSLGTPAVRTRLLAAIDTASSDILYAHGGPAPGGGRGSHRRIPSLARRYISVSSASGRAG
jgi:RNA polymerase sigma-70 factor (sigma-E family)